MRLQWLLEMGLDSFLSQLFENGRVAVRVVEELGDGALETARV